MSEKIKSTTFSGPTRHIYKRMTNFQNDEPNEQLLQLSAKPFSKLPPFSDYASLPTQVCVCLVHWISKFHVLEISKPYLILKSTSKKRIKLSSYKVVTDKQNQRVWPLNHKLLFSWNSFRLFASSRTREWLQFSTLATGQQMDVPTKQVFYAIISRVCKHTSFSLVYLVTCE